ncbi:hypothetical protein EAE89_21365 [Photorhabdus heterorhabditis]|nr:hypothetical protein [Photorhabdus heterorhabditis]
MGFFAIDQIAKIGLSSLQVIYYFEKLFTYYQQESRKLGYYYPEQFSKFQYGKINLFEQFHKNIWISVFAR